MDKKFTSYTLEEFSRSLAGASAAPGGGSVAATELLSGVSLLIMVLCLTVGKPKYAAFEKENQIALEKLRTLFEKCLPLADEDREAFLPLSAAYKMPQESEAQKLLKKEKMAEAISGATDVPLKVMDLCLEALSYIDIVFRGGSRLALSDVGVGAMAILSGAKNAWLNVLINVNCFEDKLKAKSIYDEYLKKLKIIQEKCNEIYSLVEKELYQ